MNVVSLVGSLSRKAGGLFESVRRLDQEILALKGGSDGSRTTRGIPPRRRMVTALGIWDECTDVDLASWAPVAVRAFQCMGPANFRYARGYSNYLNELAADLVHVHGLWQFASLAALRWHRSSRRPYVVSPHGMLDPWALRNAGWKKQLGWFAYERRHLQSAACLRALCPAEAKAIRKLGLSNPICVIPNGVDLPRDVGLSAKSRAVEVGLSDYKVLLYLGRLHPKKGLVPLIRAWAEVAPIRHSWRLVIAGWEQNGFGSTLRQLAEDLGLSVAGAGHKASNYPSLHFIGPQFGKDKLEWLRRCDAFVLPSFSEGLPMSVLEAWAFGKPVLVSDHCNLPDGVASGAAIPIEPTARGVAGGLRRLLRSSEEVLRDMGRRGKSLVESKYTWQCAAAEMKEVYEWVLGSGSKPECVLRT